MNGRYIRGYCLPDYASKAEEDDDMDQSKFNEMFTTAMAEYRKKLRDNDSGRLEPEGQRVGRVLWPIRRQRTLDNGEPNMMWETSSPANRPPSSFTVTPSSTASCDGRRKAAGR